MLEADLSNSFMTFGVFFGVYKCDGLVDWHEGSVVDSENDAIYRLDIFYICYCAWTEIGNVFLFEMTVYLLEHLFTGLSDSLLNVSEC